MTDRPTLPPKTVAEESGGLTPLLDAATVHWPPCSGWSLEVSVSRRLTTVDVKDLTGDETWPVRDRGFRR